MDDRPAFLDLPPEKQGEAFQNVMRLQARARTHLPTFFNFVMREEKSQAFVACDSHQRLLFEFVMEHPQCVIRMPAGTSKTFCMAALTMWLIGHDPTVRGAIVSATQGQASKPLAMVRDYIDTSIALRLVFQNLARSSRPQDPWTQSEITVARPPGIRDPSLVAVGIDGALPGSRLAWVIVDDILDRENTSVPSGRQKVSEFFDSTVLSRLDPNARLVVCNTPWHPDDITYRLERAGWPTLTMDVEGGINLANCPNFDSDEIRPSRKPGEWYRLASHDPDPEELVPLWPKRFNRLRIEALRRDYSQTPHRFNQLFMCQCRDDATARCKSDWIEQCKRKGMTLASEYKGPNPTVTGVDLAVGETEAHDATAFFTFELLPDGKRRILDIEVGHFDGPTSVQKLINKARAYNSIVRVETNGAQAFIRQFALQFNASIPVKAHTTGRANKHHIQFGVESLFIELQNGAWHVPADDWRRCPPAVQRWVDECLNYEPSKHTGDILMACWLAREQARELGFGPASQGAGGSLGMNIMSR